MTQAIIFDMDGTLFQTAKILELSLDDTFDDLRKRGLWSAETPLQQYREIMGVPLPEVWETLLPEFTLEHRSQVDSYFLDSLVTNIKEGKGELYPYVTEVFTHLKANQFDIYIASNGLKKYLNAIVEYYQLDRWVSETYSIEQIDSLNKTDLVKEIAETHNIRDGAVVGDRLSDIHAAKGNGFKAIGCHFDFAKAEELSQADVVIHDLNELTFLFNGSKHSMV
ncbi:HAD hydrolase-like protein [Halobacillus yeomjeoni]|uniref:HAD hydrolase-like protein n=1 Tax=Halobacillus yeomjeoni TaxID=311194 RepID=UPI001CD36590|nr:HAD hydrolase-like protein [Halobacillus yeomjeoni]MCA0983247.1 HAD hydrolase-like protein [Halobacillus yeomjeoni]